MPVAAFKVGALDNDEHVSAIAEILSDYPDAPLILDPFSSRMPEQPDDGEHEELLTALRQLLIPQATLLMLSQVELGRLAETWRESADETMESDVEHLLALGCEFVLVTGTPAGVGGEAAQAATLANTLFGADGMISHDTWQHLPGPFIGAGGLSADHRQHGARATRLEALAANIVARWPTPSYGMLVQPPSCSTLPPPWPPAANMSTPAGRGLADVARPDGPGLRRGRTRPTDPSRRGRLAPVTGPPACSSPYNREEPP